MPYYRTCKVCKANLDPEERCDCQRKKPETSYPGDEPEKEGDPHGRPVQEVQQSFETSSV